MAAKVEAKSTPQVCILFAYSMDVIADALYNLVEIPYQVWHDLDDWLHKLKAQCLIWHLFPTVLNENCILNGCCSILPIITWFGSGSLLSLFLFGSVFSICYM